MLATAKKDDEDEMLNNEMETSQNGSVEVDINGETNGKSSKLDITSSINEDVFDIKDDTDVVPKLNGDSDPNDWLSSSSSDSEPERNTTQRETPPRQPEQPQHLSNESSHCERTDSPLETNGSLNGSTTQVPVNKAPLTKKVRPLKICFGVKNSVNGVKVKNSKISNDAGSKVHYIERPPRGSDDSDDDNLSEPEPEPQPEYAQYVGLKPSVKFKCSRCGVKNFASMALLNEHMASCDGQTPLTVSTALPSSSVLNGGDETSTNLRITRKVFLCSSCGTYYQSYDLYIHMREKHAKQICLVCFNMFGKSQQLCDHLLAAHNLKLGEYTSVLQVRNAYKGSFYITCCTCNRLFSEDEPFDLHRCESDMVQAPQPPQPTFASPLPDDTTCFSVTRDNITHSKLPYSSQSPLAASPMRVDHLSPSHLSSPEPAPSPAAVPSLPLLPPSADLSEEHDDDSDDEITQSQPSRDVSDETCVSREPSQSLSIIAQYSSPDLQRETPPIPDEAPLIEPEPEPDAEPVIDEATPPTENDSYSVPEYTEPLTAEKHDELPESASDLVEPPQPNETAANDFSDNDSISATPDRTVEPEEPGAEAATDTTAILAEEEKIPQPLPMALMLDETVASLDVQTLIKECVRTSCTDCAYCHNATLIRINGYQLGTHLLTEHRYKPTKNEDDSEQVEQKIRSSLADLQDVFLSAAPSAEFQGTFSCFQCPYSTTLLRELLAHNRKSHQMTIFLCCICKCSFIYYSELLCHECPGEYSYDVHSLKYRCCYCPRDHLPSAFRLMVHLRKHHKSCNFCLLRYNDQHELFTHMTKQHKMPHLCYKCNIAYRSRNDISKHLFWKHGTESVLCHRCLQKKWPHTYHFCIPVSTYTCEECSRVFSKPVALTVHRRAHNGEFPFACENCDQRFISKRLLATHRRLTHPELCKPEELIDPSTEHANETQPSKTDQNSDDGDAEVSTTTTDAADGKKRRKKKRKKEKPNEKPLLDELPPLNLSSESDDESGADDESPPKDQPLETATATSSPKPSAASSPQPVGDDATDQVTEPETVVAAPSPIAAEPQQPDTAAEENTPQDSTIAAESEIPAVAESLIDMANRLTQLARPPSPTKEQKEKELLEKILNCVLVEHSYCIPESIFHSAGVDLNNSVDDDATTTTKHHRREGSISPARSHHRHDDSTKTNDDSCCKSASSTANTPRKRKHAKNNKASSGDSSSSSSSDSDSSSSSCGSNCSCNRSGSGSSSSSSAASDCSTTPEKKKPKKSKRERDEEEEKRTQQQREQMFLLDARESDLDTEISSAGEEFYEERPCYVPPQPSQAVPASSSQQQLDTQVAPPVEATDLQQRQRLQYEYDNQRVTSTKSTKNRKDKKKKKKRIKLSLAGRLPPAPLRTQQQRQPVPNNEFTNPELLRQLNAVAHRPQQIHQQYHQYHQQYRDEKPPMQLSTGVAAYNSVNSSMMENCVSTSDGGMVGDSTGLADDSNSRLSKRKRVKNKFYGYSSDEAAGRDSTAPKSVPKKRVLTKKSSTAPKNRQFIGIRAKLPPSNKRLSVSIPFMPIQHPVSDAPPVPSMNAYRSPQPVPAPAQSSMSSSEAYNPYKNRYSSSEDSDSDEKRHTLVINLPNPMKDRRMNNSSSSYKPSPPPATYSDESMSSNSYVSSPRQQQIETQQHSAAASAAAAAAAIRSQQLYRARMGTAGGATGVAGATNSPLKNSEKLYCYCQCPYDEVSEMIGCDAPNCKIEWFHFECVGIMVPPKGKWYCPSCRRNRENLSRFV